MLTIVSAPLRIALISPYLPRMVERARQLDGSWSPDFIAWTFRPSAVQAVRSAARRHYQQTPDDCTLPSDAGDFPAIAHRALAIDQPDGANDADRRHRADAVPIGLLLYTKRIADDGNVRWQFADGSAVVQTDGEFHLSVHASRPESTQDPYATLFHERHLHLALPA